MNQKKSIGRVALVGAGPGDPGLITVAGLDRLSQAEVVVYDALANPGLLDQAPDNAELIDAGKRAREHRLTQDQTNELLVAKAKEGRFVVRLKGGDPYLFGRGAEEASYLARHGIDCEVIPGITSGIAAPAAAGIPVTHRQLASTVTFVTGHEDPAKGETAIDYAALAALVAAGGTACFYMGVGRLSTIAKTLTGHHLPGTTPAAVVRWGTMPNQRHVRGTLDTIADDVEREGIAAPAIVVVGAVAGIDEPGLDGFTIRPLFGQRIIITRTRQQASTLRTALTDLGAEVLEAPTIKLMPPSPAAIADIDEALREIATFDWLVLTSANGVDSMVERLSACGLDARHLAPVKIAAIGDATADRLREKLGINADLVPTRFVAESLAAELIAEHDAAGKRFLLLRADIARPALPKLLIEAGADVVEHVAYETRLEDGLPDAVLDVLRNRNVDWITFTSSSTATNMVELLDDDRGLLSDCKIASIGPITSETVRTLGYEVALEAAVSNIEGLVKAIVSASEPR